LPQPGLAEVLGPFACEEVIRDLLASASRPYRNLIGVACGRSRGRQLVPIIRNLFANRGYRSSILFLFDLRLSLINPAQLDLIEREIAWCGRLVAVRICGEIEMGFAGHDDMRPSMHRRYGEPVRRIETGLRRDERP
jgi:hypothetical protein